MYMHFCRRLEKLFKVVVYAWYLRVAYKLFPIRDDIENYK